MADEAVTTKYGPKISALRAADALDELANGIAEERPTEAALHRKSADIIRLLSKYAPDYGPRLRLVK